MNEYWYCEECNHKIHAHKIATDIINEKDESPQFIICPKCGEIYTLVWEDCDINFN